MTNTRKEAPLLKGTVEPKRGFPAAGDMLVYVNSFAPADARRLVENGPTTTGSNGYFESLDDPGANCSFGQRITIILSPEPRNMHMLAVSPNGRPCWYLYEESFFRNCTEPVDLVEIQAKNDLELACIGKKLEVLQQIVQQSVIAHEEHIKDRKSELMNELFGSADDD